MRVLYLAPNIPVPGSHGGSAHVTGVYRALAKRHEVLVVARRTSTDPTVLAVGEGLAPVVKHLMPLYYLPRVLSRVRAFAPDVIYERYSAFGLGGLLGALLSVPTVLMTLDRDASPLSFRYAARIVATSDSFIPEAFRHKVRLVRWGVDVASLEGADGTAIRREVAPNGEAVVVYTGSFAHWHGLDTLVEVAAAWAGPPVVFVLVGDGEDLPRVQKLAEDRGVGRRVRFVGRVPHDGIGPYIAAGDVCIAPYAPERHPIFRKHGMDRDPIKVLEYMALGKPTVTIDTPRMRTLFRAGEEAVLYPPDDAAGLRRELEALLSDPARSARVGAAGEALVRAKYGWDRHAEELTAIFREALDEAKPKRR